MASLAHAALDNKGTDFIVSFLPNYTGGGTIELHLTADVATNVTVEYPVNSPTFTSTVAVNPGAITTVALPGTTDQWPTDVVANNAVRMSAPNEFVAYMVDRIQATSDAALALPIDTMNTEYIVSTYNEAFIAAQFVVTAAFDNTTVTITPSNDAQGGHPAGVAFSRVLNRGEGFMVRGAVNGVNGGLVGSIVTADKPVGLTNGNACTQVPIGVTACDTIFEVAQPTQTWGTSALVANLPNRPNGTIYRVVASQDSTTVSQDGVSIGTINRGQYLEVGPVSGVHTFSGDKPIFVTQYMTGLDSPGAVSGDPAMGNMIPTEQYLTAYTFSTVGGGQFAQHFLTVIANDLDLATITLDGVAIGAGAFTSIPGSGFSAATVPLPEGTHSTSSDHPHGITVEGYNSYDSYLYPGGALFQFINPVGDANPPLCSLVCDAHPTPHCTGQGQDNRPSEDVNTNGVLDPGEDLNANGQIDTDTGVFFVELAPGSTNLSLNVPPFVPGTGIVNFTVGTTGAPASGTVVVTDGAGNTCQSPVSFAAYCGNGVVDQASEECDGGDDVVCPGRCNPNCSCGECLVDADCDDMNPCTDETCSSAGGGFVCERSNNTNPCDDGNACTSDDACLGGSCGGQAVSCDDHNPCTNDVCDKNAQVPCVHSFNGQCPPGCGDGVVAGSETCDPPNLSFDPVTGQTICRMNCTRCGDGTVQSGEACDDGNLVSGCDPLHPARELDACLNNCTAPTCHDPASIKNGRIFDTFKFHGRLVVGNEDVDFSTDSFTIQVTSAAAQVLSETVPAGSLIQAPGSKWFRYINTDARTSGGIMRAKAIRDGTAYKVFATVYTKVEAPTEDMTTRVTSGARQWTVRARWSQRKSGWKLGSKNELLPAQ